MSRSTTYLLKSICKRNRDPDARLAIVASTSLLLRRIPQRPKTSVTASPTAFAPKAKTPHCLAQFADMTTRMTEATAAKPNLKGRQRKPLCLYVGRHFGQQARDPNVERDELFACGIRGGSGLSHPFRFTASVFRVDSPVQLVNVCLQQRLLW